MEAQIFEGIQLEKIFEDSGVILRLTCGLWD